MATYEELIQSGYNRAQALYILAGKDDQDLKERVAALEDTIDGGGA